MKRLSYSILGIATAAVLGQSAVIAQPGDDAAGDAGRCKVTIDRSQAAGVFDVTRQTYDDGKCICYAYTGPATQGDPAESRVANLVESKSCPGAKLMAVTGPSAGVAGAAAGGSGFFAGPLAPLLGLGVLGGGGAAALNAAPVSP
jgi:hypothetical protein